MTDASVPSYKSIEAFCNEYSGDQSRFDDIVAKFTELYGEAPEAFGRAPGRVNLIGEHIDYMDYSVLPMAIRQDTVVAVRRGGEKLRIASADPRNRYAPQEFDIDPKQAVDIETHSWANYFLTAYKEVIAVLESKGRAVTPCGLQLLVHGQVPAGSGLSSSAAFSCASALAVLAVHDAADALSKGEVAALATRSERNVGVSSGGMDQAASMMGRAGLALHVSFHGGLGVEYVELPAATDCATAGGTFIVMNSLAVANKAEGPEKRYNLRVVECRLACLLLLKGLNLLTPERRAAVKTLREVQELAAAAGPAAMLPLVDEHIHAEPYTVDELLVELGVRSLEADVFEGDAMAARVLAVARADNYNFPLRKRARHVFSEASRVEQFSDVCQGKGEGAAEAAATTVSERLSVLGALMTASHRSCEGDYGCSCPELEALVQKSLECEGAMGARLTGAGWGGCAVALVRDDAVGKFLEKLRQEYYQVKIDQGALEEVLIGDVLFATKPSGGACVVRVAAPKA